MSADDSFFPDPAPMEQESQSILSAAQGAISAPTLRAGVNTISRRGRRSLFPVTPTGGNCVSGPEAGTDRAETLEISPGQSGSAHVAVNRFIESIGPQIVSLSTNVSTLTSDFKKLSEDVHKCLDFISNLNNGDTGGSMGGSRSASPVLNQNRGAKFVLERLTEVVGPQKAQDTFLLYTIIVTVLSFANSVPSLRFWVADAMWEKMDPFMNVLCASTGFAAFMFAPTSNDKTRLNSNLGKMWQFILTNTIHDVISNARFNEYRAPQSARTSRDSVPTSAITSPAVVPSSTDPLPEGPDWLFRFKTPALIEQVVDESMLRYSGVQRTVREGSVSSATGAADVSSGSMPRPKRARKGINVQTDSDFQHMFLLSAVCQIRSKWTESLNSNRKEVRKHLYRSFVCVLDRIASCQSVAEAQSKGFKIELRSFSLAENIDSDTPDLASTMWNVRDADVTGTPDGDERNAKLLAELESNFQCLCGRIVYNARVVPDLVINIDVDSAQRPIPPHDSMRTEMRREPFSLLQIAQEILMEMYKVDSLDHVLSVHRMSLKAVLVIAFALRGLIVDVMDSKGQEKEGHTTVEKCALGSDVTLDASDKMKSCVLFENQSADKRFTKLFSDMYAEKFQVKASNVGNTSSANRPARLPTASRTPRPSSRTIVPRGDWLD